MGRLRRVRVDDTGWTRRRRGRGFSLLEADGTPVRDDEALARVRSLAIPPAWTDVWVCPHANGHIQATGYDDAGRRQYLYHPDWVARRARTKHDHVLDVARRLPAARRRVAADLALRGMPRAKALALAFRLLDTAYFRVGGEQYAREHGSYGLATVRREHVEVLRRSPKHPEARVRFCFPSKSGQVRDAVIQDDDVVRIVRQLLARDDEHPELLAWRDRSGWHDVTSTDVAGYVKEQLGPEATPKDFRTWHATVLAAVALAEAGDPPRSIAGRKRVVAQMVREVAEELGNTPAVCRSSYIDPRVIDLWERGSRIRLSRSADVTAREVLALLS